MSTHCFKRVILTLYGNYSSFEAVCLSTKHYEYEKMGLLSSSLVDSS